MKTLPNGTSVKIYCETCQEEGRGAVDMIVRTNKTNHTQFLGCPNWPKCTYTEEISMAIKMRLQGQPELFK